MSYRYHNQAQVVTCSEEAPDSLASSAAPETSPVGNSSLGAPAKLCSSARVSAIVIGSGCCCFTSSLISLFRFGFADAALPGGDFCSVLSWTLLAELAVGRIILAKKLSSGAFPTALRGLGSSAAGLDVGGGREAFFVDVDPVCGPRSLEAGASLFSVEGLRLMVVEPVRLGDRDGGAPLSLAAEAAVGAVAAAGRRAGRVGDFGFGFVEVEVEVDDEAGFRDGTVEVGGFCLDVAVETDDVIEVRLAFLVGPLSGSDNLFPLFVGNESLGEAVLDRGCLDDDTLEEG